MSYTRTFPQYMLMSVARWATANAYFFHDVHLNIFVYTKHELWLADHHVPHEKNLAHSRPNLFFFLVLFYFPPLFPSSSSASHPLHRQKMQCPNSPSMRSTSRANFEPRTPSTLMSRLVIHSPEAVRQRFNNADRPSTDLQKRLLHCSSSPKPSHPNLNMFLNNESRRIHMVWTRWKLCTRCVLLFLIIVYANVIITYAGA